MPTFTLPPGFAATKVEAFENERPAPRGPLARLLPSTGGPWLPVGVVGLVAVGAGAFLLLRRR
ncbi:LPXTG-motif cell wall anchor domain-containing protein [Raineyella antarctica]|uniref:LPXTG-motif cell wall anchor domain-containing protein n=1 Tax=Raineyella antarctica TaxID=1577474 RepID=A0A1G6GFN0_9ACTN|nr:LPXTG cell wall anchor domain-containing protein [Raineyella antarctica]SDB80633.1 LPXTG-motif cell wall anchor domain-containing protein [Raineyella antarctica]